MKEIILWSVSTLLTFVGLTLLCLVFPSVIIDFIERRRERRSLRIIREKRLPLK